MTGASNMVVFNKVNGTKIPENFPASESLTKYISRYVDNINAYMAEPDTTDAGVARGPATATMLKEIIAKIMNENSELFDGNVKNGGDTLIAMISNLIARDAKNDGVVMPLRDAGKIDDYFSNIKNNVPLARQ